MISEYESAKERLLFQYCTDCQQFFRTNGYTLELAYCKLLDEKLDEAKKLFVMKKDEDVRARWALIMISLIEDNLKEYPTYFQLRNFLEIDLNILIKFYKGDYVENIIKYADFMFTINPETHKFIGRVLYNNGLEKQALMFFKRAKDYYFNDPELQFQLAYIFYLKNDFNKAKKYLKNCLNISPQYFPAVNLFGKISD